MIERAIKRFDRPTTLRPNALLADGVSLSFDGKSAMSLVASTENSDGVDRLIIRASNRHSDDWLGLEITVPDSCARLDLTLRYAPSERLFPRVYYTADRQEHSLDEPDRTAPATYGTLPFDTQLWRDMAGCQDITGLKLALLLPARPWLALGLQSIIEVPHA